MDEITHRSRVDGWFLAVLLVGAAVSVLAAGSVLLSGRPAAMAAGVLALLIGAGLPLWLLRSTRYEIGDRHLRVYSGPFKWTIALAEIDSVEPSRSPWSSPALSLERLELRYADGKRLLISPRDRDAFVRDLQRARDRAG